MRYRTYLETHIGQVLPSGARFPSGYHLVGHVALLHTDSDSPEYLSALAQATMKFDSRIRSVAVRTGPTQGVRRLPQYRLIGGDSNTTTNHMERGVIFRFDPLCVTFSGGNKHERVLMANRVSKGERVVDMFACVGQFALHVAKRASEVLAIEVNPVAFNFLVENIKLNGLENVIPILGDCRLVHPKDFADRVIMGFLHDTVDYLPHAVETLSSSGGIVHMHMASPTHVMDKIERRIFRVTRTRFTSVDIASRRIKEYAPGVGHLVYDIEAHN